jgi:hypothetical protein
MRQLSFEVHSPELTLKMQKELASGASRAGNWEVSRGLTQGNLNSDLIGTGNPEPSLVNGHYLVTRKVQRLEGEDDLPISPPRTPPA